MKRYVLDSNLYIDAFRDPADGEEFLQYYRMMVPSIYMSAIVVQELLAGAQTPAHARSLGREVLGLFERTGRIIAPSNEVWKCSGQVLMTLARKEGLDLRRVSKSFVNDILLALSCREAGLTLITKNGRDFARIRRVAAFEFVAPWPGHGHGSD